MEHRPASGFVVGGIAITVFIHAAVIGGFLIARAQADRPPPSLGPGAFVDTQLVKFGKPRDLSFLPHKSGVQKSGPPQGLKIASNDHPIAPKEKDADANEKTDPLKKTHAELFKNMQDQPEGVDTPGEGSPTGSRAGTATEAKGDPYILSLIDQIGTAWQVPTTIKDSELAKLSATVCLTIDSDGSLTHFAFAPDGRSGNSQFDSSLEATLGTIKKVPPPPERANLRAYAARGKLCPVFSKQ